MSRITLVGAFNVWGTIWNKINFLYNGVEIILNFEDLNSQSLKFLAEAINKYQIINNPAQLVKKQFSVYSVIQYFSSLIKGKKTSVNKSNRWQN